MTSFRHAHALLVFGSLVPCLALGAGCGDSDRPRYEISVDAGAETRVNTLDDDQLRDVCESYSSYVETELSLDAVSQAFCLVTAQLTTLSPDTCQDVYDQCIASAPPPVSIRAEVEGGSLCTTSLRQCGAAVGQVEGCLNVQLDALSDILDLLTCPGASDGTREMAAELMTGVSACADIDARCTEFTQPVELL